MHKKESRMDDYICAFIDALGSKNRGNDEEYARKLDLLLRSHKLIGRDMRCILRPISDGLIIAKKIEEDFTKAVCTVVDITRSLANVALFDVECLLRGGIAHGRLYIGEYAIFGEALIRAYEVESKEAIYPRIILHGETVKELESRHKHFSFLGSHNIGSDYDGRKYVRLMLSNIVLALDDSNEVLQYFPMVEAIYKRMVKDITDIYVKQKYIWWANAVNHELQDRKLTVRLELSS